MLALNPTNALALTYGKLSVVRDALSSEETPEGLVKSPLKSPAIFLVFTSDENNLFVYTEDATLYIYSQAALKDCSGPTKTLITSGTTNSNNHVVFSPTDPLIDILPRPKHSSEALILNQSGNITLYNIATGELKHICSSASAVSWSPAGKAFTVGTTEPNRSLSQYTPDGNKQNDYPVPEDLDTALRIVSLIWVGPGKYIVTMFDEDGNSTVSMVKTNKSEGTSEWLSTTDASPPFGDENRTSVWYSKVIRAWGGAEFPRVIVTASAKSNDLAILTEESIFELLDESKRATLPFRDPESSPVGMALDFSATKPVSEPFKGMDVCDPLPIIWVLDDHGNLLAWNVFNTKGIKDGTVGLKHILEDYNHTTEEATGEPSQQAVKPAFGASPFGSTAFGSSTSTTSPFGSTPVFGGSSTTSSPFSTTKSPFSTASQPAFGASAFGTSSEAKSQPAFGASAFGKSTEEKTQLAFGASAFGTSTEAKTPAFGASAFGTSTEAKKPAFGASGFGTSTEAKTPAFGTSAFGSTGANTQPAFGASAFGTSASKDGASPFAALSAENKSKSGFGSFGSSGAFGKSSAFSSNAGDNTDGESKPISSFGSSGFDSSKSPAAQNSESKQPSVFGSFGGTSAFGSSTSSSLDSSKTSGIVSGDKPESKSSAFGGEKNPFTAPAFGSTNAEKPTSGFGSFGNVKSQGQSVFGSSGFGSNNSPTAESPFGKLSSGSAFASTPFAQHADASKTSPFAAGSPNAKPLFQAKMESNIRHESDEDKGKFEDSSDQEENYDDESDESDNEYAGRENAADFGLSNMEIGGTPRSNLFSNPTSINASGPGASSAFSPFSQSKLNENPFGATTSKNIFSSKDSTSSKQSDSGSITPTASSEGKTQEVSSEFSGSGSQADPILPSFKFSPSKESGNAKPVFSFAPGTATTSSGFGSFDKRGGGFGAFSNGDGESTTVYHFEKPTASKDLSDSTDTTPAAKRVSSNPLSDSSSNGHDSDVLLDSPSISPEFVDVKNEHANFLEKHHGSVDDIANMSEVSDEHVKEYVRKKNEKFKDADSADSTNDDIDESEEEEEEDDDEEHYSEDEQKPEIVYANYSMQFPEPGETESEEELVEEPTLSDYFYESDDEYEPEIPTHSFISVPPYISLDSIGQSSVGDTYEAEAVSIFRQVNAQLEILRSNSKAMAYFIELNQPELDSAGFLVARERHDLNDANQVVKWKLSESEDVELILDQLSEQLSEVQETLKPELDKGVKASLITCTSNLEQIKELILYHKGFLTGTASKLGGLPPKAALLQRGLRKELKNVKDLLSSLERSINIVKSQWTSNQPNRNMTLTGVQESIQKITRMATRKSDEVDQLVSRMQELTTNGPGEGPKLLEGSSPQRLLKGPGEEGGESPDITYGSLERRRFSSDLNPSLGILSREQALKDAEKIDITEHQNRHELRASIGKILRSRNVNQIKSREQITIRGKCQ